jgi:hypothetical protein
MANQLKMAVVHAILTLAGLGWSRRRIAQVLGVDRETVARYVHSPPADAKPATHPIPRSAAAGTPCEDKSSGPESLCEPFRAVIEAKIQQGLTGQRIYQDLVEGHGFAASYCSVRRFLHRLDQSRPLPFRRLEVLPGEQGQVDFGTGAPILRADGKRRRPCVFRVVLTRQQVHLLFQEEKPRLTPLPAGRFPRFEEGRRSVHRDGHIEVAKAYYSVPPEYTGRQVWVRWDGHLVRVFNSKMELLVVHVQVEPGTFQTKEEHLHAKKIAQVEQGTVSLRRRAALLGTHAEQWARHMLQVRGIQGVRVLLGLLSLTHQHTRDEIDRACEVALTHGAVRLRTIRQLLQRDGPQPQQFAFLDEHPIIRPMSDYGAFVQASFGCGPLEETKMVGRRRQV